MTPLSGPAETMRAAAGAHTSGRALLKRALLGLVLLFTMVSGGAWVMHAGLESDRTIAGDPDAAESKLALAGVRRWADQRQHLDPWAIAHSPLDLIVVDPRSLAIPRANTRDLVVDNLRQKPDGTRRLVLAYLSVGEAEAARDYWRKEWLAPAAASSWLASQSPTGGGRYRVRYWESGWQALLAGSSEAAVDQLVAAGFDGVYIDPADAHALFRAERPAAESEMVDLIVRIATVARAVNPSFLVVLQNAEELLAHARLRRAIDAIAKEDLLFGQTAPGRVNDEAEIKSSLHFLEMARRERLPVLVVEHLDEAAQAADARRRLSELGFVPYVAPGKLGRLDLDH